MMTDTTSAHLVEAYLQRLRAASADLPEPARAELVDNITQHLAETVPPGSDEVTTRRGLDELGTPEAVAAAARAESGPASGGAARRPLLGPSDSGRLYDVGTVLVLLLGGFVVPFLGWVAGVVMLWFGPRWTTGEKVVGTLAVPVAAALPLLWLFLGSELGVFGSALALPLLVVAGLLALAVLVAVPVVLLRRARARDVASA